MAVWKNIFLTKLFSSEKVPYSTTAPLPLALLRSVVLILWRITILPQLLQLLDSSSTAPRQLLDISSTSPRQLLDSSLTAPRQLLDSSWLPVPLGCPESCFTALTSPYYDSSFTAPLQLASYYDSCFTALTSPYYDSSFTAPLQLASYCESFLQLLLHHTTTAPLQLLYSLRHITRSLKKTKSMKNI